MEQEYFHTEYRWKQLQSIKASGSDQVALDHTQLTSKEDQTVNKGTVGAVALDKFGNIAAGTSTGGLTNKKFGRIGDSAIIGAGK